MYIGLRWEVRLKHGQLSRAAQECPFLSSLSIFPHLLIYLSFLFRLPLCFLVGGGLGSFRPSSAAPVERNLPDTVPYVRGGGDRKGIWTLGRDMQHNVQKEEDSE